MEKLHSLELEFTTLEFYPDYLLSRVRKDVLFSLQQVKELIKIGSNFYKEREFVYISLRENDYNVDPTIYFKLEKLNLAGIAIVSKKVSSLKMAEFEQKFSKVPFEIFTELDDAMLWVKEIT